MITADFINGIRGSQGYVTIPLGKAKELDLKAVKQTPGGGAVVKADELVAAFDRGNGKKPAEPEETETPKRRKRKVTR